jgi:hypothetical protein
MPEEFALCDFAPHVNTRFRVAQVEDYELELTEAIDKSTAQLEQFSLIFIGVSSPRLNQGLYSLVHPRIRSCDLFLVPLGPDTAGMRYEAAFSRFVHVPPKTDDSF